MCVRFEASCLLRCCCCCCSACMPHLRRFCCLVVAAVACTPPPSLAASYGAVPCAPAAATRGERGTAAADAAALAEALAAAATAAAPCCGGAGGIVVISGSAPSSSAARPGEAEEGDGSTRGTDKSTSNSNRLATCLSVRRCTAAVTMARCRCATPLDFFAQCLPNERHDTHREKLPPSDGRSGSLFPCCYCCSCRHCSRSLARFAPRHLANQFSSSGTRSSLSAATS